MFRLFIADDHPVIRQGIIRALPDIKVVGEASTAEELLRRLPTHRCDVVLLDLALPDKNGMALIPKIKACCPWVRILVFSIFNDPEYARHALELGAAGYVVKTASLQELRTAVRQVIGGHSYVSFSLDEDAIGTRPARVKRLSTQERKILVLIADGKRLKEMAELLGLSVKTIVAYRARIREKLQLASPSALIRYAVAYRLGKSTSVLRQTV